MISRINNEIMLGYGPRSIEERVPLFLLLQPIEACCSTRKLSWQHIGNIYGPPILGWSSGLLTLALVSKNHGGHENEWFRHPQRVQAQNIYSYCSYIFQRQTMDKILFLCLLGPWTCHTGLKKKESNLCRCL